MLQDLRPPASVAPSTPDQRNSVGMEYLRRVPDGQSVDVDEVCGPTGNSSPKLRLKLHRLWGAKAAPRAMEESSSCGSPVVSADVEERHRRRAFAHYDCQSLTANLGYAAKLRGILLARRRNTATGASAASSFRASTPDETPEEDAGDGRGEWNHSPTDENRPRKRFSYACRQRAAGVVPLLSERDRRRGGAGGGADSVLPGQRSSQAVPVVRRRRSGAGARRDLLEAHLPPSETAAPHRERGRGRPLLPTLLPR